MSVANKFRQTITKALSLSDIEGAGDTDEAITRDSIIAKSVNLFTKFAQSSQHNSPNGNAGLVRRHKTLLVIDGKENDWSKVFKGCSLNGSYEVRVEQTAFNDLEIKSSSDKGASVSMRVVRNGTVIARSFRPDFVLIREYIKGPDTKTDFKDILLGLIHGLVPSVNSLMSTFCFLEKPVVYSELLKICKRLGRENFPLIDQSYYQSYYEMLLPPSLPVVIKVGSANSGLGKVCVASPRGFQDVASLVSLTNSYATSESFLEGKFDLRIYKFGQRYKVYKRKSLCNAWKTNTGISTVEEIALTERYKNWADECAGMFDGLDILCVEVVHTKDDKEYIIEVNNIPPSICSDKKEDDMKCIANIVLKRMEKEFPAPPPPPVEIKPGSTGNAVSDAIQLMAGSTSPRLNKQMVENLQKKQKLPQQQRQNNALNKAAAATTMRPESAPLHKNNNNNADCKNTYERGPGSKNSSNTSLQDSSGGKEHTRRNSLTGRFFSAFE